MAEAVGLAASIASLASLALSIVSALCKYGSDFKSAPVHSEQLRKELGDLRSLCDLVEQNVKVATTGLPECLDAQVAGFKTTLEDMLKRAGAERTIGLRRLKWPFDKAGNVEYIAKIERFKSTLHLILNIEQMYLQLLASYLLTKPSVARCETGDFRNSGRSSCDQRGS
jgi:hypothetical protein